MRAARVTGWRRIANAMWDAPNDPQIFGALDNADLFATAVQRSLASAAAERVPVLPRTPTRGEKTDRWPRRRFAVGTNERR